MCVCLKGFVLYVCLSVKKQKNVFIVVIRGSVAWVTAAQPSHYCSCTRCAFFRQASHITAVTQTNKHSSLQTDCFFYKFLALDLWSFSLVCNKKNDEHFSQQTPTVCFYVFVYLVTLSSCLLSGISNNINSEILRNTTVTSSHLRPHKLRFSLN